MRRVFRIRVDNMDSSHESPSPYDLIIQRLLLLGVPNDYLNDGYRGLVTYVKNNRSQLGPLLSAILPNEDDDDVDENAFRESLLWLKWLMFENKPEIALERLAEPKRGVCGAIWGIREIAYKCKTCEHDPTCAICVPCFQNGDHEGHDYLIINTGGGCCDCGDINAWKREGFCSKHKGVEHVPPLSDDVAVTVGPVLDFLISYWKDKLVYAEIASEEIAIVTEPIEIADELTSVVVEMLLEFCRESESLLVFIAGRICSLSGLLEILLRAERFVNDIVVAKLHELLFKLLSEPVFKYEFARLYAFYYPCVVKSVLSEGSDSVYKKYPLVSTFSVQILTVPSIIPRLVEEMDLMGMLLQSLGNIFYYSVGEEGKLQVTKLANVLDTTVRVVEDIRYVMSHSPVIQYICYNRRDLVRTWMELLSPVQGMDAQKRETGSHIEDENEYAQLPLILLRSMSKISSLLVAGAFSESSNVDIKDKAIWNSYKIEDEDQETLRHAKVIKLRLESSIGSVTGKNLVDHETNAPQIPPSALWLTYECLRSIGNWLELENMVGPLSVSSRQSSYGSGNKLLAMKRTLSKCRSGGVFKSSNLSSNRSGNCSMMSESLNKQFHSPTGGGYNVGVGLDYYQTITDCDENMLEGQCIKNLENLWVLSVSDWPDISYDISSQFISMHIPLHRLLSLVLHRALKECYDESASSHGDFFGRILEGFHPYGFSGYMMEHPLRVRVFCAQVHAGMWRRNGDAPLLFNGWYRSVHRYANVQELDLFLLQCCGALAPPDLYVHRILERFGLSDYLSLNLEQPSEHEPTLVADMLTLLVQIVKERRLCGLTPAEYLKKELIYRLSIGDATRSQLLDSLSRDLSKVKQLQEVLDTVAEYSHPSGMTQGMYKLRSSYWKELDLYHLRSNSRDQQAAEERYLRFCNVSALTNQLPKWTNIYYPLKGIAKIATCKTLLQIVRSVLFYAVFSNKLVASRAPDGVLLTALHLLALSLDVCRVHKESGDPSCYVGDVIPVLAFACEETIMGGYGDQSLLSLLVLLMKMHEKENTENFLESGNFSLSFLILNLIKKFVLLEPGLLTKLQKLAPQLADQFSCAAPKGNVKDAGTASDSEKRKAKSRERQAAVLAKMRAQQSKFLESFNSNEDEEMTDAKSEQEVSSDSEMANEFTESAEVICSLCHEPKSRRPPSYLVLFQKSRLLTFVGREAPTWKQFVQSSSCTTRSGDVTSSSILHDPDVTSSSILHDPDMIKNRRLLESIQSAVNDFASIGKSSEVHAFIEFVKAKFGSINVKLPSISKDAREMTSSSLEAWEEDAYSLIRGSSSSLRRMDSENNERVRSADSLLLGKYIAGLPKETFDKPSDSQISRSRSESSTVHQGYDKFGPSGGDGIYVSSCGHAVHQDCLDRYLLSLRERYTRRIIFEGGHIVDPDQGEFLCPVCRGLANSTLPAYPRDSTNVPQSLPRSADGSSPSFRLQDGLSLLHRAADIAGSTDIVNAFATQNANIPQNIEPTLRFLCRMYYPDNDKILESGRAHPTLILWDTLKYTLISAEIAARSRKGSLKPNYSISALYKEINSTTGFILSMLLNVIESTQVTNSLSVLLRLRGIQLFVKSLCHGAASDDSHQPGGNMLYILENVEEIQYPDIQLWKRANEPVLSRDPFSSLMWILYCLPRGVLSCKESLLSLVHTFYLVAVIQALFTRCKRSKTIETDVLSGDSLIGDIYGVMGECAEDALFFDPNDFDPAYDLSDSIRSLTFSYLRRCALLWKLINSSNSMMPFSYGSASGLESPVLLDTIKELTEIEKLEKLFNIPSLSIIFTDERSRAAALGWLDKFRRVSVPALRCVGAIPFKLIHMPHSYQDLLQRFIKRNCTDCGVVKVEPALCLLCGKLCSPNWKPCCRKNSCQTHAMTCGAGTGVFLLIRKTTILLQRLAHQETWPSPYLDAFGEEDNEMVRGKPLFLNEERYAALTHMVASHGLDRSSKVLRQTTVGAFFMI